MFQGVATDLERYMNLLSVRQKLVASNIANADTPGYRTKDINFREEFLNQLDEGSLPDVVEPNGLALKPDGNNVSIDRESRLLAENSMRFSVASNLIRSELHGIRSAIDEGKTA